MKIQLHNILKKKKNIFFLSILILSVLTLSIYSSSYLKEMPKKGGSITEIIIGKNLRNINPVLATTDTDRDMLPLIYSSVLKYDKNRKIVPNIADFSVSKDNKTYTLNIKKNIKFSNGNDLTSDDIIFTINKIKDPLIDSPFFSEWLGVKTEKISKKSLKIILTKPYAQFEDTLTNLYILPKNLWKDTTPSEFPFLELNNHPIGSGPYKIESTIRDKNSGKIKKYILRKNPFYFKNIYIDEVNLVFFNNLNEYKKSLLYTNRKIIKNIFSVPTNEVKNFANNKSYLNYNIEKIKSTKIFGLFLNKKIDYKIREIIALNINKENIVKKSLLYYANIVNSPIYFNKINRLTRKERSEKIDKILKNSDWKIDQNIRILKNKKTKKPLELKIAILNSTEFKKIAKELEENLSQLGIKLDIIPYSNNYLVNNVIRTRNFDILLFGYQTSVNPDYYFLFHSTQTEDPQINISGIKNKKIDKATLKLRTVLNEEEKKQNYKIIENEILKSNLFIPIYSPNYIYITDKRIKNINIKTINSRELRFKNIGKWYTETKKYFSFYD